MNYAYTFYPHPPGSVVNKSASCNHIGLAISILTIALLVGPSALASPPGVEVAARVAELKPHILPKLRARFRRAGLSYPPQRVVIVVLKLERKLRLYAAHRRGSPVFVHEYFVRGTSGKIGPKLREGDYQVPEGIYGISHLNPNSRFHLSLHIDYPNAFDRQMAMRDGRDMLGGNIYIHGGGESTGCVAIGDEAVEELFVLAADVGAENLKVVISPLDLRQADPETADGRLPRWAGKLYLSLRRALAELDEQRP